MDPSLIFWMIVAGVIGFQLFSVLGKDDAGEQEEKSAQEGRKGPHLVHSTENPVAPMADEPAWLATIRHAYPEFQETEFLSGASSLYEMIVTAFARGDLTDIKPYIDAPVLSAFESVIAARKNAGQISEVTFVGLDDAEIVSASRVGNGVQVVVDFSSNQKRVLKDAQGAVIEGVENRIDLVKDRWTYERPAGSTDPNWTLVATGGASPGRKST